MKNLSTTKKLSRDEMKAVTGGIIFLKICYTEGDAGCTRECQQGDPNAQGFCDKNMDCLCDR